jgi:hypothetical protein
MTLLNWLPCKKHWCRRKTGKIRDLKQHFLKKSEARHLPAPVPPPAFLREWQMPPDAMNPTPLPYPDQTCTNPGPYWARIICFLFWPTVKTPVKCFFPVRVENKPFNRSICRNSPDFNVKEWPLKAQESRIFLIYAFTHPVPGKAEKTRIWGSFFRGEVLKNGQIGLRLVSP